MYLPDKNLMHSPVVAPEAFTVESLIAWLETMPADQKYCWEHAGGCLFHQYGAAHGLQPKGFYSIYSRTISAFGPDIHGAQIASSEPHTFGAALARARSYADGVK